MLLYLHNQNKTLVIYYCGYVRNNPVNISVSKSHCYFLEDSIMLLELARVKFYNDDRPLGQPPKIFTMLLGGLFLYVMLVGERDI